MSLLTLSNVSKSYAGAPALRAVSFAVAPGEIHALMGENGAGKSTLIKILAGVVMPDRAGITIDGRPVTIDDPAAAFGLGLRFIHQELSVVPTVSVAENIFLGRPYPRRLGPFVAWRQLAEEGRRALLRLGITHIDPRRKMARLGVGDQMLVRISSAFLEAGTGATARLTVMDEPTAALSGEELERLFAVLREIRRAGGSVLYVSHRIDEVMRLCDRVTVLRDGALIATTPIRGTSQDEIIRMMTGRQAMEAYPPPLAPAGDEPILEVRGLAGAGLGPLDFDLRKGEIVGIAGLAGAGQSEVLRLVAGAESATAGTIRFERSELPPGSPAAAWARGFAYVPRERRAEGLVLSMTVAENVTLPHLRRFSRAVAFLARRRERAFAGEQGGRVRLKARGMTQRCRELSGGNQQKVVFARALGGNPRVLLLDEPTRGVDVGARIDIYSIIRQLSAAGAAVLIASSDFPEMLGLCDRIIVMRDGVIAETVSARGLTEEALIRHCYGPGRSSGSPAASATGAA